MADDVLYTMTVHRIRKAHVLGASMGGAVAIRVALSDPDRCLSATLLSTTPGRLWQDPHLPRSSRRAVAAMHAEHALARKGYTTRALNVRTRAFGDDQRQHKAIIRQGYNPDSKQAEAYMMASGVHERLGEVRGPSLVVHGELDEIYPVGHAWCMHHGIRASKLMILPGVNHRFPTEWSVPFAEAIADHASHQCLPSWHKKKPIIRQRMARSVPPMPKRSDIRPPVAAEQMPAVAAPLNYSYTPPGRFERMVDPYTKRIINLDLAEHIRLSVEREKKRWEKASKKPLSGKLLCILYIMIGLYVSGLLWSNKYMSSLVKYMVSLIVVILLFVLICCS